MVLATAMLLACGSPQAPETQEHWCPTIPLFQDTLELVERCDLCKQQGGRYDCPGSRG